MLRAAQEQDGRSPPSSSLPARWESLSSHDRVAMVDRLIERILYDGQQERMSITFRQNPVPSDEIA
jgi:hypothetical protein